MSFKSSGAITKNFTAKVVEIVRLVPFGRVTTYGIIAAGAGNRCGARQVARILHSCSEKYDLPWHRVVNRHGQVSLRASMAQQFQRNLIMEEGVSFDAHGKIDFDRFLWRPE